MCTSLSYRFIFSMANLKIELSKLDSETWPGALDIEKEKLMLIHEKEELLKELQFVTPQKRTRDELERLEGERRRLEDELLSARGPPSRALAERFVSLPGDKDASDRARESELCLEARSPGSLEISVASVAGGRRPGTKGPSFRRAIKHTLLIVCGVSSSVP